MKINSLVACFILTATATSFGSDHFLVIGGGYSPSGNQASLEKNVLLFQRVLSDVKLDQSPVSVYFADGNAEGKDLEVLDRDSIPKANRLMAEFFGSQTNLGLAYRNHNVPKVSGAANPTNVRKWFLQNGKRMKSGDRLIVYVTAHGSASRDRNNAYDTTIATWNKTAIKVSAFVKMLDELPTGVEVAVVMVQCHAGGFARFIFQDADPDKGLSKQKRVGFFATVHDRPAAGCTSEVDEASYVEYSTYFWAALSGKDRLGQPIEAPDYNKDGTISFDEAHAYTLITADTIDLPIKTSGEFLKIHGKFGKSGKSDSDLLPDDSPYDVVLGFATASDKAVLEGLSAQLKLAGNDRVVAAYKASRKTTSRSRTRRPETAASKLKRTIAADIKKRWPQVSNLANPVSVDLMTNRGDEFIAAIEGHKDYRKYRKLADEAPVSTQKTRVKYERFLRVFDNVIYAENLKRGGDADKLAEYQAIVAAESGTLGSTESE